MNGSLGLVYTCPNTAEKMDTFIDFMSFYLHECTIKSPETPFVGDVAFAFIFVQYKFGPVSPFTLAGSALETDIGYE